MGASRVRFATGDAEIVVRVVDNPTSRDFVAKLPLTLTFEEFAGREKISYLPDRLTTDGSPGADTRNGDPGGGVSDDVIAIGTVESGMDQLNRLERGQVTVEVLE
ncbi:cyclophilin-like fold protein [Saccharothrix deserti]|uniref:cyclophilin-like fold protein n=1 Tax=Saccharothrix deserti TaxID=2593674 RepID=UPI00131C9ACE|nr:cyclophilin-like fold protein [Saccharothrix deserti]